jgi:hypothetical protein
MGFRKYIPGGTGANDYGFGETYLDCKITNFVLTLPNDGLISARVDAVGRDFILEGASGSTVAWGTSSGSVTSGSQVWNAGGEFEDYPSIPIGSTTGGKINVPGFGDLPVIAGQIGIQNMPLDPRSEKVYGSPMLEDVTIVSRAVTLDLTVKWTNPALYRAVLTGGSTGTAWSSQPFTTAVQVVSLSANNIPSESVPYLLQFDCSTAMLALTGGIQLAGGQAVLMRFTGTCLDSSSEYVTISLRNKQANYTWPVA